MAAGAPAGSRKLGILFIVVSAFFFAADEFVRQARGGAADDAEGVFPQSRCGRASRSCCCSRRPSQFKTIKGNLYPLLMRSVAGTLGVILNFSAIDNMDIADRVHTE